MATNTLEDITVEQAVFASNSNSRVRGYQIVARSAGVDGQVTHELVKWSPSHGGLVNEQRQATGLCYFRIGKRRLAFGHSVYGTPEFSGRGGLQTVTSYLVTCPEHLAGFQNDPWIFTLFARSQGLLRYHPVLPDTLPAIPMQAAWSFGRLLCPASLKSVDIEVAEKALDAIAGDRRVAIIGPGNTVPTLRWILKHMEEERRLDLTFSIGIQPSVQRPFQLQFLDQANVRIRSELSADQVMVLKKSR